MIILALDLATTTGWAIGTTPDNITSGTWSIAPARGESPGMRYLKLRAKLNSALAAFPDLKAIYYEQAHHRGGAATEYAAGCVTHVQSWCAEHGIEHGSRHSASIKRHAAGAGNANKDAVMAAMRRLGHNPVDDNEADALALLRLVIAERDGQA